MYTKNPNTAQFAPGASFDALAEQSIAASSTAQVQQLSTQMMKILEADTFIVVPLAGVFRIVGTSANVNFTDLHPSGTNQTWFSLTKNLPKK